MGIVATRWARRGRQGLLRELRAVIAIGEERGVAEISAPAISGWTVHQHLEHLWRADTVIVGWLRDVRDGTAQTDGASPTVAGTIVMWLGAIPRGRGRAPEFTKPVGAETTEIVAGFQTIRDDVEMLGETLNRLAATTITRRHPLLGCYTPAQWLRFAHIHHVHHRRIIEEIRRA
jgi:hypothetical protein